MLSDLIHLRIFLDFVYYIQDFFFIRNIHYSNSGEIIINLHMTMTILFIVVVNFYSLYKRIDDCWRKLSEISYLS